MPATFKAAPFTAEDGTEIWVIQVEPEAVATPQQVQSLPEGMSKVFPHPFILACEDQSGKLRLIARDEVLERFNASMYPDLPWRDTTVPLVSELRPTV